ncbi:ribulose 1,5-bisphosphate carboxylase large subunit [Glaciecola punicea]|jgi:ribulose-bisphosphate carboxylase large chain|uniref:RuBisCO large subunit C-terminal-like domain-containing protein n=1 Tax=Glaciecola punicea TaxID=56804 RepID=UPI0008720364|nr:RuBisCO large subunit C-terminal-like domain-containing protein [Glaciecola punicea]OFA29934.1 ribulose 1,5-bisphosphate carboxylase large subunit [Glaciecola punicea]
MIKHTSVAMSGQRFVVIYHIVGSKDEAQRRAEAVCIEQTIEFPADLISNDDIRRHVFGQIVHFDSVSENIWEAKISYALEVTGHSLNGFLNVMFGNTSLQSNIKIVEVLLPESFTKLFKGPRFGIDGLRTLCDEPEQPLFCTALKPMGLSNQALAAQAYEFAKGGIHLIKDDHGIFNQPFSPFRERVKLCVEAVNRANAETGMNCRYTPTLNSPANQIFDDARWAKEQGVGGFLVMPGISGFDTMRCIADDGDINLPILGHPSMLGSWVSSPQSGYSHYFLFGQLMRLAGADTSIYPNFGGRFAFSVEQCESIVQGASCDMGHIKRIIASPGGGMNFKSVPKMIDVYGKDIMFLIGGALHQSGPDIASNCKELKRLVLQQTAAL